MDFGAGRLIFFGALLYYILVITRRLTHYSSREGTAMADTFQNEVPRARIFRKEFEIS